MVYRVETNKYGAKHYYRGNKLHRDGGLPAVEWTDGSKEYYENGKRHRDGGLPAIIGAYGSKLWYDNGKLHRDGGLPAVELRDGYKAWYDNGKLHRIGGLPAIERSDGRKEYYVNGIKVSKEQAQFFHKMKIKRTKRVYRGWYDITYQVDKPAFKARMERDMNMLENEIGYELQ